MTSCNSHMISRSIAFALISLAVLLTPVYAQGVLEEVIVTATKRELSEQDIPISIETVAGDYIRNMSVNDLNDLDEAVPNLTVGYGITTQAITIRGLGTGQERSFEQAVGMFIDGFYMPRSRQYQSPFLDVQRVEVARGPQAVIHGLNATAGAISIVTNKTRPGDPFFAEMTADYELEYGGGSVIGVIGGSPSESLGLRAAIKYADRDGFFENTYTGVDEGDTDEVMARVSAVWDLDSNVTLTLKYEHGSAEMEGNTGEIYGTPGALATESPPFISGMDGMLNWKRSSNGCRPDVLGNAAAIDPLGLFPDNCPKQSTQNDTILAQLDWQIADHTLTVLGGHSEFEYDITVDLDTAALSIVDSSIDEDFEQDAVEVRLTSPQGGMFEYLAGVYYHQWDNHNENAAAFGPAALGPDNLLDTTAIFDQRSELWSVFGQVSFNFNELFRISGGVRYVDEDKSSTYDSTCRFGIISAGLLLEAAALGLRPAFEAGGLCTQARVDGTSFSRNTDDVMPEVSVQWNATEDLMVYAKWGESAKSGGFNAAQRNLPAVFDPEYGDESATGYEVGFKSRWLNDTAELNVTLFRTEFDDLQVNSFLVTTAPSGAAIVTSVINNAAQAVSEGIELEGRWAISDWLLVGGSFAVLDAEFDKFPIAPCHTSAASTTGTCDLSGKPLALAADWSGNAYVNTAFPVSDSINFIADVNISFSDDYFTDGPLDPIGLQDSWTKLSARVGVAAPDDRWSLAFVGRNLTEEEVLSTSQAFGSTFLGYLEPPRTIMLQGRYRLGGE